jgi:hypothetical protein
MHTISSSQVTRLYVVAKSNGWTREEVHEVIAEVKEIDAEYVSAKNILVSEYEEIIDILSNSSPDIESIKDFVIKFRGVVTLTESENLNASPEIEIIEDLSRVEKIDGLLPGQHRVRESIGKWHSESNEQFYIFEGLAGTGKTFSIWKAVQDIQRFRPGLPIALATPTNKALKVARGSADDAGVVGVDFATVYSLLAIKEAGIEEKTGKQLFLEDLGRSKPIHGYSLVIIDESGMLNEYVMNLLLNLPSKIRVVFMGDPLQLPPVGEERSTCFELSREYPHSKLTQVVRYKGNRAKMIGDLIKSLTYKTVWTYQQYKELQDDTIQFYSGRLEKLIEKNFNPLTDKAIAFTNRKVADLNARIRKVIYPDSESRYEVGEYLIANKPLEFKEATVTKMINTGDELEIQALRTTTLPREYQLLGDDGKLQKLSVMLDLYQVALSGGFEVFLVHEDSEDDLLEMLEKVKQSALKASNLKKPLWRSYYENMAMINNFSHCYAITVHKSQGSTYDKVLVDASNISRADRKLKDRLYYVALSRAKTITYVI